MSALAARARAGLAHAVLAVAGARIHAPGPDGAEEAEITRERLAALLPRQAVFYANHTSHLDFVTLWAVLPPALQRRVRPVAAADYWGSGLRRRVAEGLFHAYLVERGKTRRRGPGAASGSGVSPDGGSQLEGMLEILAGGDSLIIFPEGTRGSGEDVAGFQRGLHALAAAFPQVPVVPVSLVNLGRILPKGEPIPVPHLSTVRFHPPLDPPEPARPPGPGAPASGTAATDAPEPGRGEDEAARTAWLERARAVLVQDLSASLRG